MNIIRFLNWSNLKPCLFLKLNPQLDTNIMYHRNPKLMRTGFVTDAELKKFKPRGWTAKNRLQ